MASVRIPPLRSDIPPTSLHTSPSAGTIFASPPALPSDATSTAQPPRCQRPLHRPILPLPGLQASQAKGTRSFGPFSNPHQSIDSTTLHQHVRSVVAGIEAILGPPPSGLVSQLPCKFCREQGPERGQPLLQPNPPPSSGGLLLFSRLGSEKRLRRHTALYYCSYLYPFPPALPLYLLLLFPFAVVLSVVFQRQVQHLVPSQQHHWTAKPLDQPGYQHVCDIDTGSGSCPHRCQRADIDDDERGGSNSYSYHFSRCRGFQVLTQSDNKCFSGRHNWYGTFALVNGICCIVSLTHVICRVPLLPRRPHRRTRRLWDTMFAIRVHRIKPQGFLQRSHITSNSYVRRESQERMPTILTELCVLTSTENSSPRIKSGSMIQLQYSSIARLRVHASSST